MNSTEQDAVAVERVAKAMFFSEANSMCVVESAANNEIAWEEHLGFYECEGYDPMGFFPAFMLAKRAIAAHNAVLRERSRDADVVEAAAKYIMDNPADIKLLAMAIMAGEANQDGVTRDVLHYTVQDIMTPALDAMIGKEPTE